MSLITLTVMKTCIYLTSVQKTDIPVRCFLIDNLEHTILCDFRQAFLDYFESKKAQQQLLPINLCII